MTRPGAGGTEGRCAAAPRTQGSWRGSARRAAARGRRPHTRPASSVCAPGRPRDRWGAWERVLSRGGTASRAPLASGSPGPSVASVCDGAVAAFWFEQAYAYRSHAVIHALDLVSVELKLAHDRGREVNPADAQLGKCDRPLRALPAVLVADLADLQSASDGQSGAERPSKSGFPGLRSAYYTFWAYVGCTPGWYDLADGERPCLERSMGRFTRYHD